MPVLHKDLSRLSRDAKKLRKNINLFTDMKISAQESLDLVAFFFQWDSWNDMYVAWESKFDKYVIWHDLRRKDKIDIITTGESLLFNALDSTNLKIGKEELNKLVEDFSSRYNPSSFSINSKKTGFFSKKKNPNYLDLPKLRFREGLEMLASDTLGLCRHLGDNFIKTLDRPGCMVYCRQMDATDFIRVFKEHDYNVKVMSKDILLPIHIDAEILPTNLMLKEDSPFSVDTFLKHHLSRIPKSSRYRHHVTEALVDFVIALRIDNAGKRSKTNLPYLPDLKELLHISDNHESECVRNKANNFITSMSSESEIILKAKKGDIPRFLIEQYQYVSMQIREIVNKAREHSASWSINGFDIGRTERPKQGELLVIIISGESSADISFMSMVTKSIMLKFSDKMIASSEDDIWVFNPNNIKEQGIINNENGIFDFKRFNSARANLVLYGQENSCTSQAETLVTINDNDWFIAANGVSSLAKDD
jgi:hypothetical protein